MGERSIEHGAGDLTRMRYRHAAAGTEGAEVDLVTECFGCLDGRGHVGAGMAFDERFDGELQQQHAIEL